MNKQNQPTMNSHIESKKKLSQVNISSLMTSENNQDTHTQIKDKVHSQDYSQLKTQTINRPILRMVPFFSLNSQSSHLKLQQLKRQYLFNSSEAELKTKPKANNKEVPKDHSNNHYRSISNIEHNNISSTLIENNDYPVLKNVISFKPKGFKLLSVHDFCNNDSFNLFKSHKINIANNYHNQRQARKNNSNLCSVSNSNSYLHSKKKDNIDIETKPNSQEHFPQISRNIRQNKLHDDNDCNINAKKITDFKLPVMKKSAKLDTRLFAHLQPNSKIDDYYENKAKKNKKKLKLINKNDNFYTKMRLVHNNPILKINPRIAYNNVINDSDIMTQIFSSNWAHLLLHNGINK